MIGEIIYSLQIPLTTLWQTCYKYIASNMATVQIRKLSFILSYVVIFDVVGNIQNDRKKINYKIIIYHNTYFSQTNHSCIINLQDADA